MLKAPAVARIWQASQSVEGSSSRDMGFVCFTSFTQYRGKPSRAVGSKSEQHTLKNLPFHPLKDCWNRVRRTLPNMSLRLTQRLFPLLLHLKEMEKDLDGGGVSEEPAQNVKSLDEGPAVRV